MPVVGFLQVFDKYDVVVPLMNFSCVVVGMVGPTEGNLPGQDVS